VLVVLLANFGDQIMIDNSNPIARMTEFKESLLEPLYYSLTGRRKELVTKLLCTVEGASGTSPQVQYCSDYLIEKEPLKYIPMKDERGNFISKDSWEEIHDPTAVQLTNTKGANYIVAQLSQFLNDKVLLGQISRDEAVDIAADSIDQAFSYILFNDIDYEVKDATQLIVFASVVMNSLYLYLSALTDGKMRDAIVAILTGGGIQVKRDETPQDSGQQNFGEKLKNRIGN
jgi:hypothetical protein